MDKTNKFNELSLNFKSASGFSRVNLSRGAPNATMKKARYSNDDYESKPKAENMIDIKQVRREQKWIYHPEDN